MCIAANVDAQLGNSEIDPKASIPEVSNHNHFSCLAHIYLTTQEIKSVLKQDKPHVNCIIDPKPLRRISEHISSPSTVTNAGIPTALAVRDHTNSAIILATQRQHTSDHFNYIM